MPIWGWSHCRILSRGVNIFISNSHNDKDDKNDKETENSWMTKITRGLWKHCHACHSCQGCWTAQHSVSLPFHLLRLKLLWPWSVLVSKDTDVQGLTHSFVILSHSRIKIRLTSNKWRECQREPKSFRFKKQIMKIFRQFIRLPEFNYWRPSFKKRTFGRLGAEEKRWFSRI